MTNSSRVRDIKHAQRESFFLRELSQLFVRITKDEPALAELFINRITLSSDRSTCTVYFYTPGGKEAFREKMATLLLYKPSLRNALAKTLQTRYTPQLVFRFDEQFEKQQRLESLIDKLKSEGKL